MSLSDFQETYAGMADYELLNLAQESDSLTADARAAFTAELAKRGLGAQEIDAQARVIRSLKNSPPLRVITSDESNTAGGRPILEWRSGRHWRMVVGPILILMGLRSLFMPDPHPAMDSGTVIGFALSRYGFTIIFLALGIWLVRTGRERKDQNDERLR